MKISVQVGARSSRDAIEKLSEDVYKVWVTAVPVKGGANLAVVEILAREFGVSKSKVELVSGHRDRRKVFDIQM